MIVFLVPVMSAIKPNDARLRSLRVRRIIAQDIGAMATRRVMPFSTLQTLSFSDVLTMKPVSNRCLTKLGVVVY